MKLLRVLPTEFYLAVFLFAASVSVTTGLSTIPSVGAAASRWFGVAVFLFGCFLVMLRPEEPTKQRERQELTESE